MSDQPQKKSNYVNVNLTILKGIFANPAIPVVCPKKWAESVGIVTEEENGNLIFLSINILEQVFANDLFPIPVSRKWLEGLHITIDVETKPIVVQPAAFSINPAPNFSLPTLDEEPETPVVPAVEEKEEYQPSGAVTFGKKKGGSVPEIVESETEPEQTDEEIEAEMEKEIEKELKEKVNSGGYSSNSDWAAK
jgi:hypothetical protein